LGDLLALRCHCDVRIDGDPDYNELQTINNNNNNNDDNNGKVCDDNVSCVQTALVVIHTTNTYADLWGLEIWHSGLHKKIDVDSTTASWIDLERHWRDECDTSLVIYHACFLYPDTAAGLREYG
jgi:hypothetical protein